MRGKRDDTTRGTEAGLGAPGGPDSGHNEGTAGQTCQTGSSVDRAASRADLAGRLVLLFAAVCLLFSPFFPYWNMRLAAPQYPRGLSLAIYPNRVGGDVSEIDGLNHYIGMRKIDEAATLERRTGIPAIMVIAACMVIAASWSSRWAVLLVIPAILFPPLFLADMYWWLRDSGLSLDPKAAFSSSIKPFVPTVLGSGKIAQFRTDAWLGEGYYMCLLAAAASVIYSCIRLRTGSGPETRKASTGVRPARPGTGAILVLVGLVTSEGASAETLVVQPGGPLATIAEALENASQGDVIVVRGGVHYGPLVVRKSVRLIGQDRPVLDGHGSGTVVRIEAPGCELRGFTIRSSGDILAREDVGVLGAAANLRIEDNTLDDVLFGVYLSQASGSVVRGNHLRGKDLSVPRRGDLIRLWYSNDVTIEGTTTEGGRDVVLWYSNTLTIRGNRFTGGRYGLHFMYCNQANVVENQLLDNSVGSFLMYSKEVRLQRNWFATNRGPSGYGIGLKDMEDARVEHNVMAGNKVGVFIEHSNCEFRDNLVADNDKGIVIFPSASRNRFEQNSFVENTEQVVIEGFAATMTDNLWKGNFWSDYRGYDSDGDGDGDLAYRPARLFERLADRQPALRMFTASHSAQALDFAARLFPVFEPKSKFVDENPRMRAFTPPLILRESAGASRWLAMGALLLLCPLALTITGAVTRIVPPPRGWGWWVQTAAIIPVELSSDRPTELALPAILAQGLNKRFGKVQAVNDLSFALRQGETVALWGPNGAGKTTILRCLLGLLPFQGTLQVLGQACGPRGRASRKLMGYVPQEVWLHADQNVRETVRFYARLRRVKAERVDWLLREWGLKDVEQRAVRHLSGGMKQKLALVIALLDDPPVLLLDEPTSNLDARTRLEFSDLLGRLKAAGKTMLFCTHRQSEVWKLADRVIVLNKGRKVAEGTPEQVREQFLEPAHLCLSVPDDQANAALGRLEEGGFEVRRTGSRLWVQTAAGRKVEAIELLTRHGVRVLDFDLESDRVSATVPADQ